MSITLSKGESPRSWLHSYRSVQAVETTARDQLCRVLTPAVKYNWLYWQGGVSSGAVPLRHAQRHYVAACCKGRSPMGQHTSSGTQQRERGRHALFVRKLTTLEMSDYVSIPPNETAIKEKEFCNHLFLFKMKIFFFSVLWLKNAHNVWLKNALTRCYLPYSDDVTFRLNHF